MGKIKPTVGYVSAWQAVNEVNKPKMGYSSLTAYKQERFSNNIEAVYCTRRRGPLAQLLHNFMWAVSPGYRDKKLENRLALLNMIEDEIRTSSGSQAKYSREGLKSHRGEPEQGGPGEKDPVRTLDDRPSEARRGVWKDGEAPAGLSKDVNTALKNAERNVGNRQAFLDSLHRIFITAAAEMAPDSEFQLDVGEHLLDTADRNEIENQSQWQQEGGNKPVEVEDIRVAMLKKVSAQDMKEELRVAIQNEHLKSRHTRGGRIHPDAFQLAINRQTSKARPKATVTASTLEQERRGQMTQSLPTNFRRPLPAKPANRDSLFAAPDTHETPLVGSSHTIQDPYRTQQAFKRQAIFKEDNGVDGINQTYAVPHQPRLRRDGGARMEESIRVAGPADVPAATAPPKPLHRGPPKPPRRLVQPQEATQPQAAAKGRPHVAKARPKSESFL